MLGSLPAWGAWIEMNLPARISATGRSLPAWGAWIEISPPPPPADDRTGRSPHGERGLKSPGYTLIAQGSGVAPRMGSVD